MVSEPSYNPNAFAQGISTAAYQALAQNPGLPFLNRAVQTAAPPGSVFKMVTAMAGLTSGKITPTSTINCLPRYWRPPYPYNWLRRTSTGPNTLTQAIAQSCDTYFYAVGHRVGIDAIAAWAHKFGFGHPTGVDLPGEVSGVVPTVAYYEKQYGSLYPGLAYSVAIGQGADEVTLMQLAQYIGALATDGTMVKPYLVQQIKSPSGQVLFNAKPQIVSHISAPTAYWNVIRQGMIDVTKPGPIPGPGGTAGAAFVNFPIQVAAKTGTAQLPNGVNGSQGYMTFFISYAPANNPQIAVVSTMQTVSMVAGGMIARAIYDAYFHLNDPNPPFPQTIPQTTQPTTTQTAAAKAP
jgi:penicillin-binding protein 2